MKNAGKANVDLTRWMNVFHDASRAVKYGGYQEVSVEAALTSKRVAYLIGTIDEEMAMRFVAAMLYFRQEDENLPVTVMLNSPGGSVDDGMIIYDAIRTIGLPVEMCCIGKAYSMAAILLACGTHGRRFILPHGRVMLHEPMVTALIGTKNGTLQTISDALVRCRDEMKEILSESTGQDMDAVEQALSGDDHYFTSEEAAAFGLVDGIKGLGDMMGQARGII